MTDPTTLPPAHEVIARLGLEPHPEGGFYRETWRDQPADGGRGSGTAILYRIPRVIIGENRTFLGAENWMQENGVDLVLRRHRPPVVSETQVDSEETQNPSEERTGNR